MAIPRGSNFEQEVEYNRAQVAVKNNVVETLGQPGVEGYKEEFYQPGGDKSGITIGNGIDMAFQTRKSLIADGVPDYLATDLEEMGVIGLQGDKARSKIAELNSPNTTHRKLTSGEVATISNAVTVASMDSLINKVGAVEWNKKPEGARMAAISLYHIYGNAFFKHNSYKQFLTNDWPALNANMQNYGDTSPGVSAGVNNRHRIMSKYVPTQLMP